MFLFCLGFAANGLFYRTLIRVLTVCSNGRFKQANKRKKCELSGIK